MCDLQPDDFARRVKEQHGEHALMAVAVEIGRCMIAGDEAGAEMWQRVARAITDEEKPRVPPPGI